MLLQRLNFATTKGILEELALFDVSADSFVPNVIVHLARQSGVRYRLEDPRFYIEPIIVGTFKGMEAAKRLPMDHLLIASTSSVYRANTHMAYRETDKTDAQLTISAATKKTNEAMGHSYAQLSNFPTMMFRFFTVYGLWGRPDMSLFNFVEPL